jgi:hypothetical protein
MKTDYSMSDKTAFSFMILSISFIRSRLDISPHSATPKKPCCKCSRAFLLMVRQKLAYGRDRNKKARSSRLSGSKAFSVLSTHPRIKPNAVRLNPLLHFIHLFLTPPPRCKAFNLLSTPLRIMK